MLIVKIKEIINDLFKIEYTRKKKEKNSKKRKSHSAKHLGIVSKSNIILMMN